MGEPGRLSLDDSDRFSDDSERLVCSRFDCFVILRKRELRFLLGDKEGATYPSPSSSTPHFFHFRAAHPPWGPPTPPGPSRSSCHPPIKTERPPLNASPIWLLPSQTPIPFWGLPAQARKTASTPNQPFLALPTSLAPPPPAATHLTGLEEIHLTQFCLAPVTQISHSTTCPGQTAKPSDQNTT